MAKLPKHFVISLKDAHERTGLSAYKVGKQTGVATNTVAKYVNEDHVETERLEIAVLRLLDFYKLDWRNPDVVQIVYHEDDEQGQRKTLLATA